MKKYISLMCAIAMAVVICACTGNNKLEGDASEKIMVVSDVHLMADSLEGESVYTKEILTRDGRVQELDYEIVNALIDKVNEEQPDALCITGDLSFNGSGESHRELARLLKQVDENIKVLVIPGNHDMYNLKTYTYANDDPKQIKSVKEEDFKEIYKDFGYSGAFSYDTESLSYIWELDDKTWLLMLDTNITKYNEEFDMNLSGGFVDESTMKWIESNLSYASACGINVISFTHQNLITHNTRFTNGYNIGNSEELIELYGKYGVKLNFSGHLHIQNIKESNGIYDIASGGLLDYGNRYGILSCYKNGYEYISEHLSIEGIDLQETAFEVFCSKYRDRGAVNELACELNAYYFDGNYKQIRQLIDAEKEATAEISDSGNEYFSQIMDVPDVNQDYLVVFK